MPQIDIFKDHQKRLSLTLTVTHDCNLRCRYCYEAHKSRDHYMTFETAQKAVTEYMEAEDGFDGVEIDFFGGEPMLAFDLIRDVVEWFHSRTWRKNHLFFIGTNGTILTDEMKTWLVKHKDCVKVCFSLDGIKAAHDINRSNSYDQLQRNIPFFKEHWPDQVVKMTISAETIPYVAESIMALEELGMPFSANIVFEDIWGTADQKSKLLETYAQQLNRLVDYYAAHPELYPPRIVGLNMEVLLQPIPSEEESDGVRWCGAGHEMVVVNVDGSRSPCHRFAPWITGRSLLKEPLNRQTVWKPSQCGQCRFQGSCATCAGYNWQVHGDSGMRTIFHCDSFKLEVQASAKLQALKLLQKKPDEILNQAPDEAYKTKRCLDNLLDLAQNGV